MRAEAVPCFSVEKERYGVKRKQRRSLLAMETMTRSVYNAVKTGNSIGADCSRFPPEMLSL
jgi:hypothetical protein